MPVYKTLNNRVIADEPEPDDVLVQVAWFGPGDDGKHRKTFHTPLESIDQYQACIDWAVSMADMMVYELYVIPMTVDYAISDERLERMSVGMTSQERGELRRLVVTTCCELMRDSADEDIRKQAFALLAQLKVIDHDV